MQSPWTPDLRLLPLLGLLGCAHAATPEAPPPDEAVAVSVAPVQRQAIGRPVHGAGRLQASTELPLAFPFGGIVADVRVEAGARVRAGEVIAVLDDAVARAQLSAADSALDKATRDADRAAALEGTALSRQQREDAATGLAVAAANRRAAAFQARRSTLLAPTDGVILDVRVEDGATVGAGQPVALFAGDGGYELHLNLASVDAVGVRPGDPAEVTLDAWPGEVFAGRVVRRTGGAGPAGGWAVDLAIEAPDHALASGLIGGADLHPAPAEWSVVPIGALAEADGARAAVYVPTPEGTAARRPVTLAFVDGDRVAIRDGLDGVDAVIAGGVPFVRDGGRIRVDGGVK